MEPLPSSVLLAVKTLVVNHDVKDMEYASTSLDLNGPILSIVTDTFAHSVGDTGNARTSVCVGTSSRFNKTIAFTGVGTATFPAGSPSDNDGTPHINGIKLQQELK